MKTRLLRSKVEKDRIYYVFWGGRLGGEICYIFVPHDDQDIYSTPYCFIH